jgi:hypothetical protein
MTDQTGRHAKSKILRPLAVGGRISIARARLIDLRCRLPSLRSAHPKYTQVR